MKNFVFALIAMLAPVAALAAEVDTRGLPGIYCEKPEALLYQEKDMNDFLDVTIVADHQEVNDFASSGDDSPRSRAVVRVQNSLGVTEVFAALLSGRGHSRKEMCESKPLRLEFVDPKISEEIKAQLAKINIKPSDQNYLLRFHSALMAIDEKRAMTPKSASQGFFATLGDDIKIVTHCGPNSPGLDYADEKTQNDRVRGEYYLYKILNTLKMPVEAARGAHFTYLNPDGRSEFAYLDPQGKTTHQRPGFFREPRKSTASRCGLSSKDPKTPFRNHPDTLDQIRFLNNFIWNSDWGVQGHNVSGFWDKNGNSVFVAYDFDLSDIFVGEAREIFPLDDKAKEIALSKYTLKHRAQIQTLLDLAILEPATRKQFDHWFKSEIARIEKLVSP